MTHHSTGAKVLAWIGLIVLIVFSLLTAVAPTANGPTVDDSASSTETE